MRSKISSSVQIEYRRYLIVGLNAIDEKSCMLVFQLWVSKYLIEGLWQGVLTLLKGNVICPLDEKEIDEQSHLHHSFAKTLAMLTSSLRK